jgi:hypothetical protein
MNKFSRGEALEGKSPVVTLLWQSRYSPRVWWVPGITDATTRGRAAVTLIDQCVLRQHAHTHSVRHANTKSRQQQKVKAQCCCCRPTTLSFSLFPLPSSAHHILFRLNVSISLAKPHKSHTALGSFHMQRYERGGLDRKKKFEISFHLIPIRFSLVKRR